MGPVQYLGRLTSERGKSLFEILYRLKNFGVGRIVYRHKFIERYPEKSYYVITRFQPHPENPKRHLAWGHKVFRGESFGEHLIRVGFKPDWRLVPRHEEEAFTKDSLVQREHNVIQDKVPFPPLMQYMMRKEMEESGQEVTELPMLSLRIRKHCNNRAIPQSEAESLEKLTGER